MTLCPEHLEASPPRIEVINLDRWVSQFLKRKSFERRVAYFGEARDRLDEIWQDVFLDHELPEGLSEAFVKAEWAQVAQAKGLIDERAYLKVSRAGRGTPLDRRKRAALWKMFADYRARMISEGLAEPDDAYREATDILRAQAPNLPYTAVIVDEAQDMGEQAFRLIRAIVPETPAGNRNAIFIVGDAHQRIYARKASMAACGINVRGRSRRLRLNYRTTHEIRAWAVSILEGVSVDDLDEGTDTLRGYVSLFHGPLPDLAPCRSEAEELDGLGAWVRAQLSEQTRLADIGVLCATRAGVERVRDALVAAGIDTVQLQAGSADDRTVAGVRISTMHRAKGLEFFAVAIPFLSEDAFPPAGALNAAVDAADRADIIDQYRSLLHVAATRAKKALRVSWSGGATSLIPGSAAYRSGSVCLNSLVAAVKWIFASVMPQPGLAAADSDEAGHAFQTEAGHLFRFHSGRRSDLKPATSWSDPGSSWMMGFGSGEGQAVDAVDGLGARFRRLSPVSSMR